MQVVEFSDGMFTLFRTKYTQTIHSDSFLLDVMCIVSSGTLYCRSVISCEVRKVQLNTFKGKLFLTNVI